MKNYRFTISERDNNNKTPTGKLPHYNAYMCMLTALQICSVYVHIHVKSYLLSLLQKQLKEYDTQLHHVLYILFSYKAQTCFGV